MKNGLKFFIPILITIASVIWGILLYNGVLHLNNPSLREYPVQGVDVSAYQGTINWKTLSGQNIRFAYIKATEGSGMQDENFNANWRDAAQTTLKVGAYHFFSFESPGATQADNYIKTVPKLDGSLPPAVDLELYRDFNKKPPAPNDVDRELGAMLAKLEAYYGKKPVIYITEECFGMYIRGSFAQNPIWLRNVFAKPTLPDGLQWTFWQYSARHVLPGYVGEERFIDMNVYNGSAEQFNTLCEPIKQ